MLSNAFQYWKNVDETIGQRIEDAVKVDAGASVPGMGVDEGESVNAPVH